MIIPTGFMQVSFVFQGDSLPYGAVTTIGVELATPSDAADVANAMADAWEDEVMPVLLDSILFTGVHVKVGPNATGPSFDLARSTAGGDSSGAIPGNTAYLALKYTTLGGRRQRGRSFIPGVAESAVDNGGIVEPSKVAALQDGLNAVKAAAEGTDATLVLLHTHPDDEPTPLTFWAMANKVATQRRRLRR